MGLWELESPKQDNHNYLCFSPVSPWRWLVPHQPETPKLFLVIPPFLALASCSNLAFIHIPSNMEEKFRKGAKAYMDIISKDSQELSHGISDRSPKRHPYLQKKLRNTILFLVIYQAKFFQKKGEGNT